MKPANDTRLRSIRWEALYALSVIFLVGVLTAHGALGLGERPSDERLLTRILDIGPGLATVTEIPGGFYMVYDTGHWAGGGVRTFEGVREVVPEGEEIDLLILSHSDSDHLAATDEILSSFQVGIVIRTGLERTTNTWRAADAAIAEAVANHGTQEINLKDDDFSFGTVFELGEATITVVSGFHEPPDDWDISGTSEERNAGSIVVRLEYAGRSILFTGDIVGRHLGDPPDTLLGSEKFIIDNGDTVSIDSDVVIAPHHGADNANSEAFIAATSPEWVIFSAGHDHEHPRATAVQRYLDFGVPLDHLLRTDLGDDEGGSEWSVGSVDGRTDPPGDDDIDIVINSVGVLSVNYRRDVEVE